MKILIFMEDYFCGGVDTFVINLINNWSNDSDELFLICNSKHTGLKLIQESIKRPCKIITHKILIFTGFFEKTKNKDLVDSVILMLLKITSPILRYLLFIYNIFALKKVLLNFGADRLLIVNNGYPSGDSCRAATITWGLFSKKPLSIHNFHGLVLNAGLHIKLQEFIVDYFVSRFSSCFVAVSKAAAESMRCRKTIYKKNKIRFIFNGYEFLNNNDVFFNYENAKQELGLQSTDLLCLMLGAYHCNKYFNKGHYFLFKAFKKVIDQIPAAHLLVCGYGSNENIERVRRLALSFGIEKNIHLSGFRNNISSLLKHTDVLLISSQTFESFCFAGIEAMAHCVPVVATRVGAIPEIIVNDQGGYCVEKEDVDSFADNIIKLLSDINLRSKQGKLGYQRYKDFFTGARMSQEYVKLIHNGQ